MEESRHRLCTWLIVRSTRPDSSTWPFRYGGTLEYRRNPYKTVCVDPRAFPGTMADFDAMPCLFLYSVLSASRWVVTTSWKPHVHRSYLFVLCACCHCILSFVCRTRSPDIFQFPDSQRCCQWRARRVAERLAIFSFGGPVISHIYAGR